MKKFIVAQFVAICITIGVFSLAIALGATQERAANVAAGVALILMLAALLPATTLAFAFAFGVANFTVLGVAEGDGMIIITIGIIIGAAIIGADTLKVRVQWLIGAGLVECATIYGAMLSPLFIGIAVAIVGIGVLFVLMKWQQHATSQRDSATAVTT